MTEKTFHLPKHIKGLMNDSTRHKVIVAHRRWGKTSYGVRKIILKGLEIPNSKYFYIAPTYKQAKMISWTMFEDYLRPLELTKDKNETELRITLKTGSTIELKGADYPDSLRGVGLDGAFLDEYPLMDPSIFSEIIRPALADKQGWSDKAGTPKGKDNFYDDFVMSGMKHFYPASKTGIIPESELAEMRKEMSEDEYAQEMECSFLYFSGQIYKEFKREQCVIKPREVKGDRIVAIDYGLRNPTAILFATIDYDGRIFITDMIYESGKEVSDLANMARAIWGPVGDNKIPGVIDPTTNAKDRVKNGIPYSLYEEFNDNGFDLGLAPNQVIGGINLVKQFLSDRRIFIFDRCEKLIWEMENYRWKDKRSQDSSLPEEPLKVNDHATDALRYLVASRFNSPVLKQAKPEFHELSIANIKRNYDFAQHNHRRRVKEYANFK